MAKVKPFCCIRPRADLACDVAALPYDVYDRQEAKAAVQGKPLLFLNIDRPETQFDETFDMYSDAAYACAKQQLSDQLAQGVFVKEKQSSYYLYELTMNGHRQTGIVGCSSIDDYLTDVIKKHENTIEAKERDRIQHVSVCQAQTGPILLAYRSDPTLKQLIVQAKQGTPLYQFVSDDGIGHAVWQVSDPTLNRAIEAAFEKTPTTYIADGHHRTASAVKVGLAQREAFPDYRGDEPFNYFLSVLFADDELLILPYNRAVKDLNGLSETAFWDQVTAVFDVQPVATAYEPSEKGTFGLYFKSSWYQLRIKTAVDETDPVASLDASLLQNHLLYPILGIADPRTDSRIGFIGGIRGVKELERIVDNGEYQLAISLYPTQMDELLAVADAGLLMPPKSTWFEPKLRSGLFIHEIQTDDSM